MVCLSRVSLGLLPPRGWVSSSCFPEQDVWETGPGAQSGGRWKLLSAWAGDVILTGENMTQKVPPLLLTTLVLLQETALKVHSKLFRGFPHNLVKDLPVIPSYHIVHSSLCSCITMFPYQFPYHVSISWGVGDGMRVCCGQGKSLTPALSLQFHILIWLT